MTFLVGHSTLLRIFIILCGAAVVTDALQCYSCHGTGGSNECEQHKTYVDAMMGDRPEVKKNCSQLYGDACSIETFSTLGNTVSHIRDCSDGKTFSFNATARAVYNRLMDLQPNNETACVWDGQNLVCLTTCTTDFCNGPILEEVSSACAYTINVVALLMLSILSCVFSI